MYRFFQNTDEDHNNHFFFRYCQHYNMAKLKSENITELVCRACLKMNTTQFNIFDHRENDRLLADMLMDCTSLEIQKEDGFPINMCNDCMEKLTSAFDFKTMVIKSNTKLHDLRQYKGIKKDKGLYNDDVEEVFIKTEHTEKVPEKDARLPSLDLSLDEFTKNDERHTSTVTDLSCKNEEEMDVKVQLQLESESLDENGGFSDDSAGASSSSEDPLKTEQCEKIKQTGPVAKQKKKRGNLNNYDEKHAELLDNPDYKRIISSGLTKKQKDRETVFCAECNKTFSFRYYVAMHAYIHTGKVPYKCDKCEKRYPKESLLRKHMRSHFQTRDFACDVCGNAFFKKQQLQYHKALKHSEERPYKCNVCDRTFKIPSTLWKHALSHVNDKKYVCEICGKAFVEMVGLKKHKGSHVTEKNFVCTTCGKAFTYKRALSWHLKKHLDEKPYICSYCGKRFHYTAILKNHILIHTGAKPYACEICGKTFRQRSCIGRHMRVHTGETPYPCKLCPSSFKFSHHLANHMKIHEKELAQKNETRRISSDDTQPVS